MGVNTYGIINKGTTITDIKNFLESINEISNVKIIPTHTYEYMIIVFCYNTEDRNMSCFFGDYGKVNYGIDGVLLSLSYWGSSIEIILNICTHFGGFICENDAASKLFKPVDTEKLQISKEVSKRDELTLKLIKAVGYDKLDETLALFDEYKNIL
jgi:hypothetical protein